MGIKCEVTIDGYTDFIFVNREGGTYHQGTMNKTIRRITRDCNDEVLMKGEDDPYSFCTLAATPCDTLLQHGCVRLE